MPQGTLWHVYSVLIDVLQLRTRGKQNQVNEMGLCSRFVTGPHSPLCNFSQQRRLSAQAIGSFHSEFTANHIVRNAS